MVVEEKQPFIQELKRAEAHRRTWVAQRQVRALGRREDQGNLSSSESFVNYLIRPLALSTFFNDCRWYRM